MNSDWKQMADLLPKQPCDDLMQDALSSIYDWESSLGENLILFHRESVETSDETLFLRTMDSKAWEKYNATRKRHWGARCTCSMCGEEFIAGYSNRRAGAPGIVLTEGDDGMVYEGYAEPGLSSIEYFEGDSVQCPRCSFYGTLTHRKALRHGRTSQVMHVEIAEELGYERTTITKRMPRILDRVDRSARRLFGDTIT